MIRSRKTMVAALAAAGLALGLGACSAQPGVAARVGGTAISETEVTSAVQQYDAAFGQSVERSQMISGLIQSEFLEKMAKNNGITITDTQVDDALKSLKSQGSITEIPAPLSEGLYALFRGELASSQLSSSGRQTADLSKEYSALIAGTTVELNPRYGTFDATKGITSALVGDVVNDSTLSSTGSTSGGGSQSGTESGGTSGQSGN